MTHVWLTRKDAERLARLAQADGVGCTLTHIGRGAKVEAPEAWLAGLGFTPGLATVQRCGGEFAEAERWARVRGRSA